MKTRNGSRSSARIDLRAVAFVGIVAALAVACGGGEKKAGGESATAAPPGGAGATAATGGMPAGLPAPAPGVAPAGATLAMLAEGDSIFHGLKAGGLCQTCHGPDAAGTPLAPPLANKQQWLTGDGSYDFIQKRVTTGMPQPTPPYSSPDVPDRRRTAHAGSDQVRRRLRLLDQSQDLSDTIEAVAGAPALQRERPAR